MSKLSLETVVVRQSEPLTATVDDELVMLDPRDSRYLGLDPIGARIWELLEQPVAVDAVCSELMREFDVAEEVCCADVLRFLEQLDDAKLIEIR